MRAVVGVEALGRRNVNLARRKRATRKNCGAKEKKSHAGSVAGGLPAGKPIMPRAAAAGRNFFSHLWKSPLAGQGGGGQSCFPHSVSRSPPRKMFPPLLTRQRGARETGNGRLQRGNGSEDFLQPPRFAGKGPNPHREPKGTAAGKGRESPFWKNSYLAFPNTLFFRAFSVSAVLWEISSTSFEGNILLNSFMSSGELAHKVG